MEKKTIKKKIELILKNRMNIIISEDDLDVHLLGKELDWMPRKLVYLYFFIQEEFDIEIDKKYILDGSFSTINSIIDIIYGAVNFKELIEVK